MFADTARVTNVRIIIIIIIRSVALRGKRTQLSCVKCRRLDRGGRGKEALSPRPHAEEARSKTQVHRSHIL